MRRCYRTAICAEAQLGGENLSLFETDPAEIRPITTRERTPTPY